MIKLQNVSLSYPMPDISAHSFQNFVGSSIGGLLKRQAGGKINYVQALNEINLTVQDGCRLGIIGHNGAGKTTLLRVLAGVYPVTSGTVDVNGSIRALTDFSLGMDPNASGYKNIIFRLIFMGYSFSDAKAAIDEIISFSDLGDFINLPIRTYSTGMYLRLAFAISTHFPPDILILDEVIGAGDEAFRAKAQERLNKIMTEARIVVLSTHDFGALQKYCNRALLMSHGKIVKDGSVNEVVDEYTATI